MIQQKTKKNQSPISLVVNLTTTRSGVSSAHVPAPLANHLWPTSTVPQPLFVLSIPPFTRTVGSTSTAKTWRLFETVTTTTHGTTKKTIIATEVTGELSTPVYSKPCKQEPSTKCKCPAKFFIRQRTNNGLHEVEWHWKHQNHNPFSLQDIKIMRALVPFKAWLSEKVFPGMSWPTLRKLLHNSNLTRVSQHIISMFVQKLTTLHRSSITQWIKCPRPWRRTINLWKTWWRISATNTNNLTKTSFIPWKNGSSSCSQWVGMWCPTSKSNPNPRYSSLSPSCGKKGKSKPMAKTYSVFTPLITQQKSSRNLAPRKSPPSRYYYVSRTLVVDFPLHGSWRLMKLCKYTYLLPIFQYLNNKSIPTLSRILQWLLSNHNVHPKAILTNFNKALNKAIANTYASSHNPPKHYCVVHVMKAARRRAGGYVSSPNTNWNSYSQANSDSVEKLHHKFVWIVYSPTPKEAYYVFFEKWHDTQPRYVWYIQSQWGKSMDKWAIGLQYVPLQSIHTNNFIESWHRNLKYRFLNQQVQLRLDKFIHTLVFDIVPDFRQTVLATQLGFRG